MSGAEQRKDERFETSYEVRLGFADEESFFRGYAMNVSRGGLFITSRSPAAVGTPVRFALLLAGGEAAIDGEGAVAWLRPFDAQRPEAPHGMGIRFTRLSPRSERMIERMIVFREEQKLAPPGAMLPPTVSTGDFLVAPRGADGTCADPLDQIAAEAGLTELAIAEAVGRGRARVASLIPKLGGGDGELDWLKEPQRPEPLPTPEQALAQVQRILAGAGTTPGRG